MNNDLVFVGAGTPIPKPRHDRVDLAPSNDAATKSRAAAFAEYARRGDVEAEILAAYPNAGRDGVCVFLKNMGLPMVLGFENAIAAIMRGNGELVKPDTKARKSR